MLRSAAAVLWRRPDAAALRLLIQALGLAVFGVYLETALEAIGSRVPREVFQESSFTWALLQQRPVFWLPALFALGLGAWSFTAEGSRRLGWERFDTVGGLRWVVFAIMITLGWPYGAHPYNHYYDQAHLLDRALVFAFMLLSLRSPVWIPFFGLQVAISRAQTFLSVHMVTPIVDEVPFRILCAVAGFGLWNLASAELRSLREGVRLGGLRLRAAPIETHVLVFSVLCLFGSYYVYAGVGKVGVGIEPLDWVRYSHMDNLFIGAWLNGWNAGLPEAKALEIAGWLRRLSIPIAAATLAVEVGMLFVLAQWWVTVLLLASVVAMHLAIMSLTGVFFWTWTLIAGGWLVWLLWQRGSEGLKRLHSPVNAVLSFALTGALAAVFGWDPFAWWNSKWNTMLELDAVDRAGNVYRVDYSDFSPYLLVSFWEPYGPSYPGWYGGTPLQTVMQRLETVEPEKLKSGNDARWAAGQGPVERDPALDEFIQRFFRNRNRNLDRNILALPPPPTIRMRDPRGGGAPYRGQAPVVEVRVRYVEKYYTGSSIYPLRDTLVHTIPIPAGGSP